ncbi:MAG: transposase [Deltaproteobacteria bacterium]|nr:transposase [Deltaproteobacteria bacterium]
MGTRELEVSRGRIVDEAILGADLSGANTRRVCKALEPLIGSAHLSKSAVSRVALRLKAHFAEWKARGLCALVINDNYFCRSLPVGHGFAAVPALSICIQPPGSEGCPRATLCAVGEEGLERPTPRTLRRQAHHVRPTGPSGRPRASPEERGAHVLRDVHRGSAKSSLRDLPVTQTSRRFGIPMH